MSIGGFATRYGTGIGESFPYDETTARGQDCALGQNSVLQTTSATLRIIHEK